MTPFKQPSNGRRFFANQESDFMDAETESVESPPSPGRAPLRQSARNRLFDDDGDDDSTFSFTLQEEDRKSGKTPLRGSFGGGKKFVKPLNLSFEDENSDDDDDGQSSLVQRRNKRLEKLAESGRRDGQSHTPTRAYGASSGDSMVSSPYISPSSYIVTMDGRHVQSKNPFSPMITDDPTVVVAGTGTNTNHGAAPPLPISLEGGSTSRLQKRHVASPSKRYASFTRDGYPERSGRYSFTGSPIKEEQAKQINGNSNTNMYNSSSPSMMAAHKIRRLGLNDDVHYPSSGRRNLTVNTGLKSSSSFEEISPSDVFSFPAPPTPQKAKSPKSNNPDTPFISRERRPVRRRAPDHEVNDTSSISTCTSHHPEDEVPAATVSRFKSDFDIIGELGKGSFGAVYKVLSRLDGCMYAVKAALRKAKGVADRDRMLKEVYALAALSDQADPATFHIVRYHQAFMDDDRLYIVTELCSSTNLSDSIEFSGGKLSVERRYKLLREMLLALEFIHRNSMCHLDIKPQNIFVKKDPPLDVFKLGDFGLVTKLDFHKDVEEGDSRYMSMELLSGDHQDLTKSDIFSLGCTLYEICLGRELPMNGSEWQDIRKGALQPLPETPYEMEMIIREMMNPTYANRPSAADLLKRPQLLSKEQAKLALARQEIFQARLALVQSKQQLPPKMPSSGGLTRRNTWSGGHFL